MHGEYSDHLQLLPQQQQPKLVKNGFRILSIH